MLTEDILEKVSIFQNQGSRWIFNKVENFHIHIDKYKPVTAKSYFVLPQKLNYRENNTLESLQLPHTLH